AECRIPVEGRSRHAGRPDIPHSTLPTPHFFGAGCLPSLPMLPHAPAPCRTPCARPAARAPLERGPRRPHGAGAPGDSPGDGVNRTRRPRGGGRRAGAGGRLVTTPRGAAVGRIGEGPGSGTDQGR